MSVRSLVLGLLLAAGLSTTGCATWHNPATGETRSSPPVYPECQKREVAQEVDQYCVRVCLDRQQGLRGVRNIAACQNECANKEGQVTVIDDDECNALKARQEGWTTK